MDPQVYIVSIHDEEPDRRVLAVDLRHILAALESFARHWIFCVTKLDAIGSGVEPLMQQVESSPRGVWLSYAEMVSWAGRIEQTLDGTVVAFPGGTSVEGVEQSELIPGSFPASRALCVIEAVDSSYFEVYAKDRAVKETLHHLFSHVIERDPAEYFGS